MVDLFVVKVWVSFLPLVFRSLMCILFLEEQLVINEDVLAEFIGQSLGFINLHPECDTLTN